MSLVESFSIVKSGQFTANGAVAVVVTPGCDLSASSVILINPQPITGVNTGDAPELVSVNLVNNTFNIVCGGANAQTYRYVVINAK
jgi:hypothetical protein